MLQTKRCVTRSYLVIYCHCCGDMDIDHLQNVWPLKLCGLTVDGGFCLRSRAPFYGGPTVSDHVHGE